MAPHTKEKFAEIRERSSENILSAAFELFAVNGYHSTTISAIAKKAGISKGLMYHYFTSKEALLEVIVSGGLKEMESLQSVIREEKEPIKQLEKFVLLNLEMLISQKDYWKFYFSIIMQLDVYDFISEKFNDSIVGLLKTMKTIFAEMGIAEPQLEAYKFLGMLDGVALHYSMFSHKPYPIEKVMKSIISDYKNKMKKHV